MKEPQKSEKTGRILVVDDDEDVLLAARLLLRQHVQSVKTESDPSNIPWILDSDDIDVVLLDMNFTRDVSSGEEGFNWLARIREIAPSIVVVLMTAYGDVDIAVRAIKAGASDFVLKPWQNEKLWATISAAVNLRRARHEADGLRQQQRQLSADMDRGFHDIIGECAPMLRVFEMIEKVADTDANVLILGENGTGKELVAREIHRQSGRSAEVFISVDVGAISEPLFESELFGHVRGAFTDAREDRPGRFEIAAGGTLFLDEIGNIPMNLQNKLLSVLEQRRVTRVGSNSSRPVDIRLISATNMPIYEKVAEDEFRQDLLYRINTVEIQLPPLRERLEDIPLLSDFFLKKFARKYGKPVDKLGTAARKLLERYDWPGNIRELQHALERAVIMSGASTLRAEDFVLSSVGSSSNKIKLDDYNLEQVEKQVILKVLKKYQGNVSQAARELGLTRASLYRRLEKHGL